MSVENEHDDFAVLLRRHRFAAGLSQEELAEKAGLSSDAIAALERGRRRAPRPLTVRLLAGALHLDSHQRVVFAESSRRSSPAGPGPQSPPPPPDELIGRSMELAETAALFEDETTRLLTLTGPGGVGKTRLALAVTAEVSGLFEETCWVAFDATSPDEAAVDTLASALGLSLAIGADRIDTIAGHIAGRKLLIILDNVEHVLDTAAHLCTLLLERCTRLHILVTSRELLRVAGELIRAVRPLAVPPEQAPANEIRRCPAVRLFLARAAAQDVAIGDKQLPYVSAVCRSLEGIPLAIELAAARVNILTVEQIAGELGTSSRILSHGRRTAPGRQRTLDAALDWSHDLLSDSERRLFAAVSVFAGGWTLPAASAVYDMGAAASTHTMEVTARLAEKSLVLVRRTGPEARYDMYGVIRQYAGARLDETGRRRDTELRHVGHFVELAERGEPEFDGAAGMLWLDRLDAELDNVRLAMARTVEYELPDQALRLAGALWKYCYLRGHYADGRRWLEAALTLADSADGSGRLEHTLVRAKATLGAGYLAFLQCEYDLAVAHLEAALGIYRALDDISGAALALRKLGGVARERAHYDHAHALYRESLSLYAKLDDQAGMAWSHHHIGLISWLRQDLAGARASARTALEHFQRASAGEGFVWSLISLGTVALYEGEFDAAERLLQQSHDHSRRLGYREGMAWSLSQLGLLAGRRGQLERATHLLDESLAEHQELNDYWRAASVLEALATVAKDRRNAGYAAFLLGAAAALRDTIGAPVPRCERPDHELTRSAVLAELGRQRFDEAWAAGRVTPLHALADTSYSAAGDAPHAG